MSTKIKNDPTKYLSRSSLTHQFDQKTKSGQSLTKGEEKLDRLGTGKLDKNWYLDINPRHIKK